MGTDGRLQVMHATRASHILSLVAALVTGPSFGQDSPPAAEQGSPNSTAEQGQPAPLPPPSSTQEVGNTKANTDKPGLIKATRRRTRAHTDANESFLDRTDNGLDAKFTSIFDRQASNLTSPTVILGAQWTYKFQTNTYFGLGASALPQSYRYYAPPAPVSGNSGGYRSFTTYFGGLHLAQTLWESESLRVVAGITAGRGYLFLRLPSTTDGAKTVASVKYTVAEPSLYLTCLRWAGLDIGPVVSYRWVNADANDFVTNSELRAPAFGLTFHSQGM